MPETKTVRVRFAPSPTGPLHIGSARTALFNWLFVRSQGGAFVLRIEDTDEERSKPEFEEDITNGLGWLDLDWDEFYRQSERGQVYKEYLEKLIAEHKAYFCFCSKEELAAEKEAMLAQGLPPRYSGKCRAITAQEAQSKMGAGESYVIRLKIPDEKITFKDLIRGEIEFDGALIGDTVIASDFDRPLYNFAVVVDDALMEISHVIRGEDHISNTPRQIVLARALGFSEPHFAHLPIILNPDRSKMSKRFADTALREYIEKGYIKEAMVNFLALMGWHPKEDKEVISTKDLLSEFDLSRVQKGGAVFNQEKLDWLNGQHIKEMPSEELIRLAKDFVPGYWRVNVAMIESVRGRLTRLEELPELLEFYFDLPSYSGPLLKWKDMEIKDVEQSLTSMRIRLKRIPSMLFRKKYLEQKILAKLPREDRGRVLWPLRVALSGKSESPGPFEIMEALGKAETIKRVDLALGKIEVREA